MDTFRSSLINASYQVLVDILCHKRNQRCSNLGNGNQSGVKGHVSIDLILLHTFCPETLAASSDIPVTHLIHKFLKGSRTFRDSVVCKVVINCLYKSIQFT